MTFVECLNKLRAAKWTLVELDTVQGKDREELQTKGHGPQPFYLDVSDSKPFRMPACTTWYLRACANVSAGKAASKEPLKHFERKSSYYKEFLGIVAKRRRRTAVNKSFWLRFSKSNPNKFTAKNSKDGKKKAPKRGAVQKHPKTFHWGKHCFTFRRPSKKEHEKGAIGAFAVTCPLAVCQHVNALKSASLCKRQRSWRTDAEEEQAIAELKAFILSARDERHPGRPEHLRFKASKEELEFAAKADAPPLHADAQASGSASSVIGHKRQASAGQNKKGAQKTGLSVKLHKVEAKMPKTPKAAKAKAIPAAPVAAKAAKAKDPKSSQSSSNSSSSASSGCSRSSSSSSKSSSSSS